MQKSPDITKYDNEWQLTRMRAKDVSTPQEKIDIVLDYLNKEKTSDAWERVYNWLEGLERGYRNNNADAVTLINSYLSMLQQAKNNYIKKQDKTIGFTAGTPELVKLYKDLFVRNSKWLKKGYINTELNTYMDSIENEIKTRNEIASLGDYPNKLKQLRIDAQDKENTHKFLF